MYIYVYIYVYIYNIYIYGIYIMYIYIIWYISYVPVRDMFYVNTYNKYMYPEVPLKEGHATDSLFVKIFLTAK